ncbi:MAG: hypothetical protein HGB34_00500 [Candidatus Moranbacteria bacterium]|nr:hypothetical protein [Candidatus Moranbacteria bacterium]NTW75375.1 hypothetical protein [Candidatus Moranbacteria bacterium]
MPQDIHIPEGKIFSENDSRESGPRIDDGSVIEQPVERALEASKERAGERFSEILSRISKTTAPAVTASDDGQVELDAKSVYNEADEETRIAMLLSLVETKGPVYAVRVAQHLNDNFVLDRMHDELAGRFYEALVSKGVIRDE